MDKSAACLRKAISLFIFIFSKEGIISTDIDISADIEGNGSRLFIKAFILLQNKIHTHKRKTIKDKQIRNIVFKYKFR